MIIRNLVLNSLRPSDAYMLSKLANIVSDNGLLPGQRQAIIWTSAGMLLIGPLGTNFSEIFIKIHTFSFKKMHLKTSSAERRPFCLGLNVLIKDRPIMMMSWYGDVFLITECLWGEPTGHQLIPKDYVNPH